MTTLPQTGSRWLLSAVTGGLLFSLMTVAGRAESWLAREFAQADADGNGVLSTEEARPFATELKGADANGDGVLSFEEVRTHLRALVGEPLRKFLPAEALPEHFKKLDGDGDGRLSEPELKRLPWLRVLDEDGDGAVTLKELQSAYADATAREPKETVEPLDQPPPPYDPPAAPATTRAPRRLKPAEFGVGRRVPAAAVTTAPAEERPWTAFAGEKGTVIALVSPSCPVGKRYLPELARQSAAAKAQGVAFLFVNLDAGVDAATDEAAAATLARAGLTGAIVTDASARLRATLAARTTTETYVIDAAHTLVYRGAIDDRYGVGWSRDEARATYLQDAIASLVKDEPVAVAATEAPGCALEPTSPPPPAPATYHNRISRILQQNCVSCHQTGGLAPFPLETPAQVAAKAGMIRRMVDEDLMPPWFAKPAPAGQHTPWGNERSLAAADKADLLAWLAGGRPEGDAAEAPLARTWPGEWELGTPDAVFQIPRPITVKAEGTMPYQHVMVETGLTEDRWIQAWEVLPTARAVVHHVLIWAKDPLNPNKQEDQGLGFLAAYVPGSNKIVYPEGLAKKLPKNSKLRFQIHYTPVGEEMQDQIRLGIHYADGPPTHVVEVATLAQPRLRIPPGAPSHPEAASLPLPADVRLLRLMPHMHVRGHAFRYEVVLPGGEARTLLEVPRYDFNWQLTYDYAEFLTLPAGSRFRAIGWFDNSTHNPHNPDPTRTVPWGDQTSDEMMIGYAEYYVPSQPLPRVTATE